MKRRTQVKTAERRSPQPETILADVAAATALNWIIAGLIGSIIERRRKNTGGRPGSA